MSDNSTGAGGSAAPGWYADPYDPSQLRWWSGQVWTEHVSPAKPPVAEAATEAEVAQPAVAEPEPALRTVAEPEPALPTVAEPEVAPSFAVTPSAPDALPSRRALREASLETEAAQPAPASAESVVAVPASSEPASSEPAGSEPATSEPVSSEPASPAASETAPAIPIQQPHHPTQALRPEDFELAADQNRWNQPLSTGATPAWGEPNFAEPTPAQPSAAEPDAAESTSAVPEATVQPAAAFPTSAQPTSVLPEVVPPAAVAPGSAQPVSVQPAAVQPAAGAQPDTGATTTDDWGLRPTGAAPDATPRPKTGNTPWVWFIAISPLIAAAILIYGLATGAPSFSNVLFLVGFVAPYLLVVVFAVADRSRLVVLGHIEAASWTWAALTAPVYLVVRGGVIRRELGSAGPALYVWLACFVVGVAGFALYGLLSGHALVPGLPEGKLF